MNHALLIVLVALVSLVLANEKIQTIKPNGKTFLFENFEKDPLENGWIPSKEKDFIGKWVWTSPKGDLASDEKGLLISEEAKHFGITKLIQPEIDNTNTDLIVQYSVKFETNDGLTCGGSYIKLFEKFSPETLSGSTPYAVMFGPDRCGANDKVHFIVRHQNPKSKETEEKHMKNPPTIKNGQETNLYTLAIYKDNTFEIFINLESVKKGSMLEDFEPSFTPSKEIDDPSDKKPADWVDQAEIDDPEAKKPEDWNEEEPMEVLDTNDTKPLDWDETAQKKIPDPAAKKPEDWNDEEDGKWEPPMVENPQCKIGCGKWTPRTIKNPKYKGKWTPSKIKNPKYIGEWKPKKIPNPSYVEIQQPHVLPKIGALAIEVWTMTKNIFFDNFLITDDLKVAKDYAEKTWRVTSNVEKETLEKLKPKENPMRDALVNFKDAAIEFGFKYPVPIAATVIVLNLTFIFLFYLCCCASSSDSKKDEEEEEEPKKVETKKVETKKLEEKKVEEKVEEPKKEEPKKVEEPKKEESKKETKKETKKEKKAEEKKEEVAPIIESQEPEPEVEVEGEGGPPKKRKNKKSNRL